MSIRRFRYFFKVARLGSVREAAEVLHVAPSAISRQIAKLEEDLGTDLIETDGRGIRLTPAGEILAEQVSRMVDSLDQARSQIDDLLGLRRGHVRVWTVEGSVGDLVLPALRSFQKKYPAITHELIVASTDRIVRGLIEDDTDIGVAFNPPNTPELISIGQSANPLLAIMHPRHSAVGRKKLTLAEIVPFPLALPDRTFGLRHMLDAVAKSTGVVLAPVLTTNSIEALRAFARLGVGVTILPGFAVVGDVSRRLLRTVPLGEPQLRTAQTAILTRRGRYLPMAASQFAEHLVGAARAVTH